MRLQTYVEGLVDREKGWVGGVDDAKQNKDIVPTRDGLQYKKGRRISPESPPPPPAPSRLHQ